MGEAKQARKRKSQPIHYLLTISAARAHVHTYLITDNSRCLDHAIVTMFDQAAAHGLPVLPLSLCTTLKDDGRETIRSIIGRHSPEAAKLIAAATDYHQSVWIMPHGSPDNDRLMELH